MLTLAIILICILLPSVKTEIKFLIEAFKHRKVYKVVFIEQLILTFFLFLVLFFMIFCVVIAYYYDKRFGQ